LFYPGLKTFQGKAVTTIKPNQRPQSIQSVISGRIENGMFKRRLCKTGDTILFISEIKRRLYGSNLVQNTKNQLDAKSQALNSIALNMVL
jgi:hypothetical protein